MPRMADDQPSVNAPLRADPIVHYAIKFTVNRYPPEKPDALAMLATTTAYGNTYQYSQLMQSVIGVSPNIPGFSPLSVGDGGFG